MIELHIDFEGKYGLRPYGLRYDWLRNNALHKALELIYEFARKHPEVSVKIFYVGALLADRLDYKRNLEAMTPYLHSHDMKLLQRFWMETPLSLEVVNTPSNVFIGSHTFFHVSAHRINPEHQLRFYQLDQLFMDQIFSNVPAEKRCEVVFPENVVPTCAEEVFEYYRPGFTKYGFLNSALQNIDTTLLPYEDLRKPLIKRKLLSIYRPLTMMLNRTNVFYTHCHNILSDPRVLSNFSQHIALRSL